MKKISFIVPYPSGISPGQRFRFEQYIQILQEANFSLHFFPFFKSSLLVKKKGLILPQLMAGFWRRAFSLFKISGADFVFIFREAAPIGPPVFEWIVAKVFRKKIIYDFDDAIWLTDNQNESWIEKKLRCRSKIAAICKWSYKVSAGNDYLANYARQFNKNVIVNPTTIDTETLHNPLHYPKSTPKDRTIIGWTGSSSTLKYLKEIEAALQRIEKEFAEVEFWVIADSEPGLKIERLKFKPWSRASEVSDLAQFDIGIMPLPADEWSKGKCGFKILQYMALGIPTVASPVGVNSFIISPNENGFLAQNENDWVDQLEKLIEDSDLRKKIGARGLSTVQTRFSVVSNRSNFVSLFT